MATVPKMSSIGLALAGMSSSVEIPNPGGTGFAAGHDNLTAVATKAAADNDHRVMLPTPPNSISPTLPPTKYYRANAGQSPPASSPHVDSDVDLQDAVSPQALSSEALDSLADLDGAGAITPNMLAKHHLPDILLSQGPLAIRHIMGYLTTSVPGFSRMPPAKARRVVVGALEGRGSGGEGGGPEGNVVFEKVGWGRWDARLRGQAPRDRPSSEHSPPSSLASSSYPTSGLQIPANSYRPVRARGTANSAAFSGMDYDENDVDMLEHEADKMSLDGHDENVYCSSSEAPDELDLEDLGEGDVTDEEDWAAIGAAALRARSFHTQPGGSRLYQPIAYHPTTDSRSNRSFSKSAQVAAASQAAGSAQATGFSFPNGVTGNTQEREAVEALLKLGSM